MYTPETSYEEFIKKEQEKYPELNLKDVEVLKERVEANEDLPRIPDKLIVMFLHSSYFNVDAAYNTIVVNYKYRKELPHVFANYDPSSEEMKNVFETITICVLTDSCTGKEERILYTNFKNTDPQKYDYVQSVRYFFMMVEYLMVTHGTFDGVILTMNSKGINWRHITKTPMSTLKKLLGFVQEALPVRLKEVHVLNSGYIVTALYNIVKPFMRSSLIDMLKLYPENSPDAVFKNLPIDIMPAEIGGNGKSHYEYSERTFDGMLSVRDWFLSLD